MSKFSPARKSSLKKKKHWSGRVHDSVISRSAEGLFNVVIDGGGDYGEFPCIGDLKQDKINYISGKLHQDEILLEVNGQAVSGLTRQDVCRLIKESPDPLALRTVKTGTYRLLLSICIPLVLHGHCFYYPNTSFSFLRKVFSSSYYRAHAVEHSLTPNIVPLQIVFEFFPSPILVICAFS